MNFNKFQKISINFFLVIFLFSIFYLLFSTDRVLAAGATRSWEEEGLTSIDVSCAKYQYPWCQEAEKGPGALVGRFYTIALGLAAAAALGVLIYGAILWTVSGAVSSKKDAMEWISGAIWGLILLLGAYLILYTINPDLVKLKGPEELFKMESMNLQSVPPTSVAPISHAATPSQGLSEQDARQELAESGIGVKGTCPLGQATGCVNLDGIKEGTLNEITSLVSEIGNDNIYVTAGTEGCGTVHAVGTYSHCNGYKTDLRLNTNLNNYITQNFQYTGTREDGAKMYKAPSGAIYSLEKDHWDVLVI